MVDEDTMPLRQIPTSDADFNSMVTQPRIGSLQVNPHLRERLKRKQRQVTIRKGQPYIKTIQKGEVYKAEDGKSYVAEEALQVQRIAEQDISIYEEVLLWDLLGYYTQDDRLSKINEMEKAACIHYKNLAGDCIREGFYNAGIVCIERCASLIELSQSEGGFLRNLMATLKYEKTISQNEPKKRGLFGMTFGKKKEGEQ